MTGMRHATRMGLLCVLLAAAGTVFAEEPATQTSTDKNLTTQAGQTERTISTTVHQTVSGEYLLFLPEQYGAIPDEHWPLLLFLHGSGERGRNLNKVRSLALPKHLDDQPNFPFIVVSPQCPPGKWWTDLDVMQTVLAILNHVQAEYKVDPDRVSCTGLSLGGYGTWQYGAQFPDRWAALVPVCGWGNPYEASRLKGIPVWAFHGGQDKNVPPALAKQMAGVLQRAGGDVRLSIYPQAGHFIWDQTYKNPELWEWLLQQKRSAGGSDDAPSPSDPPGEAPSE